MDSRRRCNETRDEEDIDEAEVALQSQEDVMGAKTLKGELAESMEGLAVEGEAVADGADTG